MDTGKGTFQQVTATNQAELLKKMDELERAHPGHGGWFREGEIIEIRGSRFRVQSVKPNGLRLKLLERI